MRTLILAGLLVAGLIAAGVIHIQSNNNTIDITVDRQKLQDTEQKAIKVGSSVLHQAEAQLQKDGDQATQIK